ncbi:hypothetical protein MBLNU459_g5992t3 [Dothideomycetes sp. NU459]
MAESIELPSTHRAAFHKANQAPIDSSTQQNPDDHSFTFSVKSVPLPTLGPSDLLIRLSCTGICGTDLALAAGHLGPTAPILGHEGVGRIASLGSALSPTAFPVGARVGIAWTRDTCTTCAFCLAPGGETRCVRQLNSARTLDGSFAEFAVVPARYVVWLPPADAALPDELVAPVLCGGVTAYAALKLAAAVPGSWVVVSGAGGGVGALAVQYARAMGYRVVAVDAGDAKRRFCLDVVGADAYVDALVTEPSTEQAVMAVTGEGAKAVLVSAGSGRAYQAALGMLAPYGTLVCVGIPPPDQMVSFHPLLFIDRGIKIVGSAVGTRGDILEALEFVKRGLVKPDIRIVGLEDLDAVVAGFGKETGKCVIKF